MKLKEIVNAVEGTIANRTAEFDTIEITTVTASDLMSDVLTVDAPGMLLVTALALEQTLRTAHLVNAAGVIISGDKILPHGMAALSRDMGVTLVRTYLPTYEVCVRIGRLNGK